MTAPWRTLRGRLAVGSLAGLLVATLAFTGLGIQLVRSQTLEREAQELAAIIECTDIEFLPPTKQEKLAKFGGREKLQERLTAAFANTADWMRNR